jgi:hypothetical protein
MNHNINNGFDFQRTWKLKGAGVCNNPDSNCEISAKRFYCPECKTEYGLNYQYHAAFILIPIVLGFIYCFARTL